MSIYIHYINCWQLQNHGYVMDMMIVDLLMMRLGKLVLIMVQFGSAQDEGDSFPDICLYKEQMCNNYQECPFADDEDPEVCDELDVKGYVLAYDWFELTFTLP